MRFCFSSLLLFVLCSLLGCSDKIGPMIELDTSLVKTEPRWLHLSRVDLASQLANSQEGATILLENRVGGCATVEVQISEVAVARGYNPQRAWLRVSNTGDLLSNTTYMRPTDPFQHPVCEVYAYDPKGGYWTEGSNRQLLSFCATGNTSILLPCDNRALVAPQLRARSSHIIFNE